MDAQIHIFMIVTSISVSILTFKKHNDLFLNGIVKYENANICNMFNCVIDPACQNISIELRCYVLDPNCTDHSNPEQSSDQNNIIYAISITGGVLVLIVCFIIIMLCCKWRRAMRKKSKFNNMNNLLYLIYC